MILKYVTSGLKRYIKTCSIYQIIRSRVLQEPRDSFNDVESLEAIKKNEPMKPQIFP